MWEEMTDGSDGGVDTDQNGQTRPEVSPVTGKNVYLAIGELGLASSNEIAEHDSVNRSQRQVQRVLDKALEDDLVKSVQDGRQVLYYIGKEFVPKTNKSVTDCRTPYPTLPYYCTTLLGLCKISLITTSDKNPARDSDNTPR